MKKKNIFLGIVCFLMMFLMVGCGKKTAITTSDFTNIASQNNLQTASIIDRFTEYAYIKEATVAASVNNNTAEWQLEFYVLDSTDNASGMYNNNKSIIENSNTSGSTHSEVSLNNYSTYTSTTNDNYIYLSRVDNTFLYVNVPKAYKDNVKKVIKELKY